MEHWRTGIILAPLLLLACGSEGSLSAEELATRLTDALDFTDGQPDDGAAPLQHADAPEYPQITRVDAPDTIPEGYRYSIVAYTDFSEPERIAGVMVHVPRSEYWVRVAAAADAATGTVTMECLFNGDPVLSGDTYLIQLALIDDQGFAGNYYNWSVIVP